MPFPSEEIIKEVLSDEESSTLVAKIIRHYNDTYNYDKSQINTKMPSIRTTGALTGINKEAFDIFEAARGYDPGIVGSGYSWDPYTWFQSGQEGGLQHFTDFNAESLPNEGKIEEYVDAIYEEARVSRVGLKTNENTNSVNNLPTIQEQQGQRSFERLRTLNPALLAAVIPKLESANGFAKAELAQQEINLIRSLYDTVPRYGEGNSKIATQFVTWRRSGTLWSVLTRSNNSGLIDFALNAPQTGIVGTVVDVKKIDKSGKPLRGTPEKVYESPLSNQDVEVLKNIYESNKPPEYTGKLTTKEIAAVIIYRRAIKIMWYTLDEVRNLRGRSETPQYQFLKENPTVVQNAIIKAIVTDPDFSGLNAAEREELLAEVNRVLSISPQCILIKNIVDLAKKNRKRLNKKPSASNIKYEYTRMVTDPDSVATTINKLTKNESQKNLLTLRPDQISRLFPYLRIYKTIFNQDGSIYNEVEFKFPNFTNTANKNDAMDILSSTVDNLYTQEYGIVSFDWKFIGSDPFSYANDIESTLVLYFNDFEQLAIERTQNNLNYKLLDLIAISTEEQEKYEEGGYSYDIRVDVGWNGPPSSDLDGYDVSDSVRTLFLAMTDYDISLNEEGFFELTINYKSRIEQSMYDKKTNILVPPVANRGTIDKLERELKELKSDASTSTTERIREKEEKLLDARESSKLETYSNIVKFLLDNNSIFVEKISKENLFSGRGNITSLVPTTDRDIFKELAADIDKAEEEDVEPTFFPDPVDPNQDIVKNYKVSFFFLGDLIESLAQNTLPTALNNNYTKDIRILTTDFLLYNPLSPKFKNIISLNISDIPISVDLFMSFYYEKVIKFNVKTYSLMKFIRDTISYCILNIFEDCFGADNLKTTLKTGFIDFQKVGSRKNRDPFRQYAHLTNSGPIKLGGNDLGVSFEQNPDSTLTNSLVDLTKQLTVNASQFPQMAAKTQRNKCVHALLISAESFDPKQLKIAPSYAKKRTEDIKNGLYHLDTGASTGILKKINFSKTDQKYLREQRFTQDEAEGFSILSNVFDVDIDVVGNTMFFPGQRIFINLGERFSALGKSYQKGFSLAKTMGLGGYHIVTAVDNQISADGFNTKVKARWETSGDGETKDPSTGIDFTPQFKPSGKPSALITGAAAQAGEGEESGEGDI